MKKHILVVSTLVIAIIFGVSGVDGQDAIKMKKGDMDMATMHNGPHQMMMMAYRQNVKTFAKTLRDMSTGGKLADLAMARDAFAQMRQGMEKMQEIRKSHLSMMSPDMREKMKPMMEKMQADQAVVKEHMMALDKALQADAPDASAVERESAALVSQFEKMSMPDKKMSMPDKKMDMPDKMKN